MFFINPYGCKALANMMNDYANCDTSKIKEPKPNPEDELDFWIWFIVGMVAVGIILYHLI